MKDTLRFIYNLRRAAVPLLTIFAFIITPGCSKKSSDTPIDDDEYYGKITATARGENFECTSDYNGAYFELPPSEGYNLLTIQGRNEDLPPHQEAEVVLSLLTTGELEEGTYPIIDEEDLLSCRSGTKTNGCNLVACGGVYTNDDQSDPLWGTKDVRSRGGGKLIISKIILGKYHPGETPDEAGYTEGRISGSFEFTGTNWEKTSTGAASGKFEDIPLTIYDKMPTD